MHGGWRWRWRRCCGGDGDGGDGVAAAMWAATVAVTRRDGDDGSAP
ncbi:MAG: hypothetical protein OXU62_00620 [Gammaproteobacteria bacterium]|nr:hypothetical protein [Gammaproteobacteria bacterium]